MAERKVLTKYYPPDFDPSAIGRTPKHLRKSGPKVITVRLMAPFSMKCTHCGEFIYRGRKFNARKETLEERGEITFRTDPKNMDYECERGAKRNFEVWRDSKDEKYNETEEQTLDRLEREQGEEQEQMERDKMAELEEKMLDSKREMQIADALDEIRTRNARIERNEALGEEAALETVRDDIDEAALQAEKEDEEAARKAFMTSSGERIKRIVDEEDTPAPEVESKTSAAAAPLPAMPPPSASFARVKRPKKGGVNSLGIKKKPSLV
ncbi:hypothetical protein PENANT_c004G05741 [Penicillium antarcticum]|uniref:Splicing factor YJU2 n=1 Tax=Penicillium antarcticum TaxID=416450 RepID=A0A1V6QHJ4_9EURO|nr:hypothetical protein PENANT_c004G05741 [Penicillium antarcticum]